MTWPFTDSAVFFHLSIAFEEVCGCWAHMQNVLLTPVYKPEIWLFSPRTTRIRGWASVSPQYVQCRSVVGLYGAAAERPLDSLPALLPCSSRQNCKWLVGVEDDHMWQLMCRVVGNMCQRQRTLTYIQSEACLNHMGEEKVAFWIRSSLAHFNFRAYIVLFFCLYKFPY